MCWLLIFLESMLEGIWVEASKHAAILEGILLDDWFEDRLLLGADHLLNFVRVDEAMNVGIGDGESWEMIALLLGSLGRVVAIEGFQLTESAIAPDDEASRAATRSQIEEREVLHIDDIDAGDISECTCDSFVLLVDDEGTDATDVSPVASLALSSTLVDGILASVDIIHGVELFEEMNGLLGLIERLCLVRDNERHFRDLINEVTTSHHESRDSRSSESRHDCIAALIEIDFAVPFSPDTDGLEHATTLAHVTKSTLTSTVSATTRDTRNT